VEVPATCPHCEAAFIWEVDLRVDRELAWAAPEGPAFRFRCEACDGEVRVALGFGLERGADPRPLRLVGGPSSLPSRPQILLVDHCPHGCGARLGLELGGGLNIPFKNYLDFGSGTNKYFMENGLGGAFTLDLTLNNLEVRYAYSVLGTGRVKGHIPDDALTAINLVDKQLGGSGQVPADVDKQAEGTLTMHALTVGYRFTLELARRFNLIFPLAAGWVAVQPPRFGLLSYTLYGFTASAGLRGELLAHKYVSLALDTRFTAMITEPDPNLGALGYAGTKNVFDAAVAWLPMLSVALHARVHY